MNHLFQFTYKADKVQINFLQLLSKEAVQNVTYLCKNSVAFYDSTKQTYKRAVKLMAYNDLELTAEGNSMFKYKSIRDGCQVCHSLSLLVLFCHYMTSKLFQSHKDVKDSTVLEYKTGQYFKKYIILIIID